MKYFNFGFDYFLILLICFSVGVLVTVDRKPIIEIPSSDNYYIDQRFINKLTGDCHLCHYQN